MRRFQRNNCLLGRGGISLIETVIAMVILSGAFVSVLSAVTSSRATHLTTSERAVGVALAEDLMAEILQQGYKETGITLLGLDGTEVLGPGRSQFDDLDDYDGWSSSPPKDADGKAIPGASEYTRSVDVDWVKPLSPDTTTASDTGVKRVVVTVRRGGRIMSQLTAYRTQTWQRPEENG